MLKTLLDLRHISSNPNTLQSRAMKHLCDPEAIMQIVQDFTPDVLRFISEESQIDYRLFESDTTKKILNIVLCSYQKNIYTVNNQIIINTDFGYLRKYVISPTNRHSSNDIAPTGLTMTLKKMKKIFKIDEILINDIKTHKVAFIDQDYKEKLEEDDLVYPYIAFHKSTLNEFNKYGEACKFMLSHGRSVEFINNTQFNPEARVYRNVIMHSIVDNRNDLRNARIILKNVISTPDILLKDDRLLLGFREFGALIRKTYIMAYKLGNPKNVKMYTNIDMDEEITLSSYSMYKFVMRGILTMEHSFFRLNVPEFTGNADQIISDEVRQHFDKKRKISFL